jgi:tetratricopeptide (TPR) repeat protein
MHRILIILALLVVPLIGIAQTDEIREVTGLPIPIGQPVIYGQVAIKGIPRNERRPSINVILMVSGTQIDRRQADERGYYYFLQRPRQGHTLVFEVDGNEVGRAFLTVGIGDRIRQDITLEWTSLRGATEEKTGVISTTGGYSRSADGQKAYDRAMSTARDGKSADAIKQFREILANDPNDYVAWTMLGTIYLDDKKYSDAGGAFEKALAQKADFVPALINLSKLELARQRFDKAIDAGSKAVEADPNSAEANHVLGEAYLQNKKGSLAVGYLNKAIELAPIEKAEIHLRLAALYNGAGLKSRAAAEYQAFLEKVKDHPDTKSFEKYIKDNPPG